MAVQQAPGLWRIDLQRHDLSVPGHEVVQARVDIGPEAPLIKHTHPGEEIIYVLEGSLEHEVEGQARKTYMAGDALIVPAGAVHAVRNVGTGNAAELATYVVERQADPHPGRGTTASAPVTAILKRARALTKAMHGRDELLFARRWAHAHDQPREGAAG
jgi:quercetin dioxygenase-like cupin family protein